LHYVTIHETLELRERSAMSASTTEVPTVEGVKVGDFFVSSWGYDQTNIDFYKVVALTAKRIKVQHWKSKRVTDEGPSVGVVPGDAPAVGALNADGYYDSKREAPVEIKTVQTFSDVPRFKVNSFSGARLWDGSVAYKTGSGWGR
jgi:hypothetical protein